MKENKIQVSSIQEQIGNQDNIILEAKQVILKAQSDIEVATKIKEFLQKDISDSKEKLKIENQINLSEKSDNNLRAIQTRDPKITEKEVINALKQKPEYKDGLLIPEIHQYIARYFNSTRAPNTVREATKRLLKQNKIKVLNPGQSRDIRYDLI